MFIVLIHYSVGRPTIVSCTTEEDAERKMSKAFYGQLKQLDALGFQYKHRFTEKYAKVEYRNTLIEYYVLEIYPPEN